VTNKTLVNNTQPLLIGESAGTAFFNGTIDEVALYKTALDAATISNHYLLGLASCSAAGSPYAQAIAQVATLVSYWRLGESAGTTACDVAGRNPGTYMGGFTLGQSGAIVGDSNTGTLLNGTTGWVSVPPLASLNTGDSFTFEAWVKRTSIGGTTSQVIASKQGAAWTLLFNTTNQLVLQANTTKISTSTTALTDTTKWHQVAATKSGATVKLYIDGVDKTGTVTNVTLTNTTSPLAIGQNANASFFKGAIDDAALYSSALTGSAIASHYSLGASPANTSAPTVSGAALEGQTLQASQGTWIGATSYAYQWRSCDSTGGACSDITGATASTYVPGVTLVGRTLRVVVTASNSAGSTAATSGATNVIQSAAPRNSTLPSVSPAPVDGHTVTGDPGTWTGAPAAYAYQWQRCDSAGNNCQDIPAAIGSQYTAGGGDVGSSLRVTVTATNAAGTATATSHKSATVQPAVPTNSAPQPLPERPSKGRPDGHARHVVRLRWVIRVSLAVLSVR
jgi:hypothetical protein